MSGIGQSKGPVPRHGPRVSPGKRMVETAKAPRTEPEGWGDGGRVTGPGTAREIGARMGIEVPKWLIWVDWRQLGLQAGDC